MSVKWGKGQFDEYLERKLVTKERRNAKYNSYLTAKKELLSLKLRHRELKSELQQLKNNEIENRISRVYEISRLENLLSEKEYQLIELAESDYFEINAHMDGIVYLNDIYEGKSISKSTKLLTILPHESDLVAKLDVKEKYRASINKGQKVILELEAFPKNEYGTYEGSITDIARLSNNRGVGDSDYDKHFRVEVKIDLNSNDLSITPGMTATATIIANDKSLINLLK